MSWKHDTTRTYIPGSQEQPGQIPRLDGEIATVFDPWISVSMCGWPRSEAQAQQMHSAGQALINAHLKLAEMSFRKLGCRSRSGLSLGEPRMGKAEWVIKPKVHVPLAQIECGGSSYASGPRSLITPDPRASLLGFEVLRGDLRKQPSLRTQLP